MSDENPKAWVKILVIAIIALLALGCLAKGITVSRESLAPGVVLIVFGTCLAASAIRLLKFL